MMGGGVRFAPTYPKIPDLLEKERHSKNEKRKERKKEKRKEKKEKKRKKEKEKKPSC